MLLEPLWAGTRGISAVSSVRCVFVDLRNGTHSYSHLPKTTNFARVNQHQTGETMQLELETKVREDFVIIDS